MAIFGKTFNDYLRFARVFLILTLAVGIVRLLLSMTLGTGVATVFSLNLVGLVADIYFGIRVHTTGFGSYRQLLIVVLIQAALTQLIIGAGIMMTVITGIDNAYSQFEMAGVTTHWIHAVAHVALIPLFALFKWGIASLVMFVTKRVVRRPVAA